MTDTNTAETSATSAEAFTPTFDANGVMSQEDFASWMKSDPKAAFAHYNERQELAATREALQARPSSAPRAPAVDLNVHVNALGADAINALSDDQLMARLERDLNQESTTSLDSRITPSAAKALGKMPPITSFAPAVQAKIAAAAGNDPSRFPDAIRAYVVEHSARHRLATGSGVERMNAFQREAVQVNMDLADNERRTNEAVARLNEVVSYDPKTGAPVMALTGRARELTLARVDELNYHRSLLTKIEAPKRLAAAKAKAVSDLRARAAQVTEAREAEVMADAMLREERIKARAEQIAKSKRNRH